MMLNIAIAIALALTVAAVIFQKKKGIWEPRTFYMVVIVFGVVIVTLVLSKA